MFASRLLRASGSLIGASFAVRCSACLTFVSVVSSANWFLLVCSRFSVGLEVLVSSVTFFRYCSTSVCTACSVYLLHHFSALLLCLRHFHFIGSLLSVRYDFSTPLCIWTWWHLVTALRLSTLLQFSLAFGSCCPLSVCWLSLLPMLALKAMTRNTLGTS